MPTFPGGPCSRWRPRLPEQAAPWAPGPVLLERQGLAILRDGDRYASLECGRLGGGHGHPDRLHLTLFADGVHWLADPGTGSYVAGDLFWYRSTLAHDAPRLDGRSQVPGDATCEAFDVRGGWSWVRGRYGEMSRTLVAGEYVVDVVELDASEDRTIELPWHLAGRIEMVTPGDWTAEPWDEQFLERVERFTGRTEDGVVLRSHGENGATLTLHLRFDGTLLRASAPGRPGEPARGTMYLVRSTGRGARIVAALESTLDPPTLRSLGTEGDVIEVETTAGVDRHVVGPVGWEIAGPAGTTKLGGLRRAEVARAPLIDLNRPVRAAGKALYVRVAPDLDGRLDAFDASEPMALDYDDQYRRSEEPYHGAEEFSATLLANWNEDALYLGVDVVKAEVTVRPDDAPPLRLDNEPDDIHADGIQVYLRPEGDGPVYGFLVVPSDDEGRVRVRLTSGSAGSPDLVTGAWRPTGTGYSMALRVALPEWGPRGGDAVGFDFIVNEMHPDRLRRAGQLVWSGGGGLGLSPRRSPAARGVRNAGARMSDETVGAVAGYTSTGSKRPEALFAGDYPELPHRMTRSSGCRVWDEEGREYLDLIMALGAVALGYGHAEVNAAAVLAVGNGVVGPLPPVLEAELAADLRRIMPWIEQVRFLKTGAEAMAAAVRLARTATGREAVLGCGYHGWLDWCQGQDARGVPAGTRALYAEIPFNDPERSRELIRRAGGTLAAVVFEPVILAAPDPRVARGAARGDGSGRGRADRRRDQDDGRLALGGACERLRGAAGSRGDGQGDRQRISARRGRRTHRPHGRRRSYLDLLHARDGVRLARRGARDAGRAGGSPRARAARQDRRVVMDGLRGLAERAPESRSSASADSPRCAVSCSTTKRSARG